ncbi:hypothetical protein C8T65DRAFT_273467 [Cerioporus squamosus]|nr:hypothetical protein C8T65DRAFT_273467 [Cerioporus squamosus]
MARPDAEPSARPAAVTSKTLLDTELTLSRVAATACPRGIPPPPSRNGDDYSLEPGSRPHPLAAQTRADGT